ncbi:MAG: hypothetical protein CTY20_15490 [Hyphomicrobium sp.]|nr:MAG: hypothetical protein CTY20_15490 [Hyphomicrobium sp.]
MGLAPMTEATLLKMAGRAFADVTGSLEDATLVAAEGQATPNLSSARQSCDRLIALLETTLARLQQLRRRLG